MRKDNTLLHVVRSPERLFCTMATMGGYVVLMCFWLSHGELIDNYFFWDTRDTGMDFFHSMEYVRGRNPYDQFDTLYPPLANLFFLLMYYLVPMPISSNWPDTFLGGQHARGYNFDLRTHQASFLCFIVVIMIAAWMLTTLCGEVLSKRPRSRVNWVAACMLLSPGMVYAYERGNILFVVIPLIVFFVKYRNDHRPVLRELSLISLAIAAGLKLYPAFFGVLLLRDKDYKRAARTIVYGILSVVLPMFVFMEGLRGIFTWIQVVLRFNSQDLAPWTGLGFANILYRLAAYAEKIFGIQVGTEWFALAGYLMAAVLLVTALVQPKEWQSLLSITMAFLMFQNQGVYALSMFIVPMLWFIRDEECLCRKNIVQFLSMALLLINVPIFYLVEEGVNHVSRPDAAYRQFFCMMAVFCCFWTAAVSIKNQKSVRNK